VIFYKLNDLSQHFVVVLKKMRYIGNTPKMPKPGIIRGRKGLLKVKLKTEPETSKKASGTGVSL